jgi:hypothetical protein
LEELNVVARTVVCIGGDGWTDMWSSLSPERMATAAAFHKGWWRGVRFFHRDGRCYEVASAVPVRPLSPVSKLLAHTVYNPRLTVRYEYRATGAYDLRELQQALTEAIDTDDDVLTQFHDADELKRRLALARSFDDVVAVVDFAGRAA